MLFWPTLLLACPQLPYRMVDESTLEPIYIHQQGQDVVAVRDSNTLPMTFDTDRWQVATGTYEKNVVRMTSGFQLDGKVDENCTITWNSSSWWTPVDDTYFEEEEEEDYDSYYYNDYVYSNIAELQAEVSSLHFLYSGIREFLRM